MYVNQAQPLLDQARRDELLRQAAAEQLANEVRRASAVRRRLHLPFRVALGRMLVKLGEQLQADHQADARNLNTSWNV